MRETQAWITHSGSPLHGSLTIPGDKSISHRAIMLAALADGVSQIDGFLDSEDTRATETIFKQLQVQIDRPSATTRIVHGVGLFGLHACAQPLDCRNAGTCMRLLAGLLAGQQFDSTLVGDRSLSRRPMRRVTIPLGQMGARITTSPGGTSPLRITGMGSLQGITYRCEFASAQVKSAILLAGLFAQGRTCVIEPRPTRDYTERLLEAMGVEVEISNQAIGLHGQQPLHALDLQVPGDFSSAAFFIVAASIVPGSELMLRSVGLHPRRTGLLAALQLMGGHIEISNQRLVGGERIADLRILAAPLRGITLPEALVADMIDEFPAFLIAAAAASGPTRLSGAAELRVKESDRLAVMVVGLRQLGIKVEEKVDGAIIFGGCIGAGTVESHGDHRIAMAFAVAGQIAQGDVYINDVANVATSFPQFVAHAQRVGFALNDLK